MKLTQKQEWIIARHLRDAELLLGGIPEAARARTLARMKKRVYQELERSLPANTAPQDEEVTAILLSAGTLSGEAIEQAGRESARKPLLLVMDHCWWLGVCGGLGKYFGVSPGLVRAGFIFAGITGPVAITVYLVLYFAMYFSSDGLEVPPIDPLRVVKHVAGTVLAAVALHVCTGYVQSLSMEAYCRWVWKAAPPDLGEWDWLASDAPAILAGILVLFVPLAVLSGLPLANRWDYTWKRIVQAGLAVYAAFLSFGLACYWVGMILHGVKVFMP